ncbi:MAG: peptidoglycan-associated lipoprotein Pal [Gammaproteobacteria bacterium]|nr:peptidoglycan-associated lipoprotein Pal [Gammaproteobacteria bacterium]NNJ73247.1 peptidoglycan-associated lipoprotein Pal [Enterobacterales bacterium]
MLFEKSTKLLITAICAIGLAACSTTPDVEETATETVEPVETVETTTVTEPTISAEEQMRMESEEMRKARTVYFEFDDATVQQQYLAVLELHAKFLAESGMTVTLEGHADERGAPAYNLALGEQRANSVAQYLMNYGLAESQITVVSYGEERPADMGHSEGSWEKNRRVEIVYR